MRIAFCDILYPADYLRHDTVLLGGSGNSVREKKPATAPVLQKNRVLSEWKCRRIQDVLWIMKSGRGGIDELASAGSRRLMNQSRGFRRLKIKYMRGRLQV